MSESKKDITIFISYSWKNSDVADEIDKLFNILS